MSHRALFCVLLIGTAIAAAQDSPAPTTTPAATLSQLPQSPEAFAARLAEVDARLSELRPTTQPTTAPADEAAQRVLERQMARYVAWSDIRDVLRRAADLTESITRLRRPDQIEAAAQEVATIESETHDLKTQPLPTDVREEQVRALQSAVQTLEARVNALADAQAQRATLLTEGLEQRRQTLETERKQLRQQQVGLPTPAEPGGAPTTAPATPLNAGEQEILTLRAATNDLRLQTLALERQQTELVSSRDKPLLAALREKLAASRARETAVTEAWSRSRVETLESQRETTVSPAEAALVELKLFHERVLQSYFRDPAQLITLESRVSEPIASRLRERISQGQSYWDRILETLPYRSGHEISSLYEQIRTEIGSYTQRLREERPVQTEALTYLRTLRSLRDRALRRFGVLASTVESAAEQTDAARRAELESEVATLRADLTHGVDVTVQRAREVSERSETLLESLSQHVDRLNAVERTLYWRRLTMRNSGLLGSDWRAIGEEFTALVGALVGRPTGTAAAPADLESQLFGREATTGTRVRDLVETVRQELAATRARGWLWTGLATLAALIVGLLATRTVRTRSVPLAARIAREYREIRSGERDAGWGLSDRINLSILNMIGDLAAPLLIGITLIVGARQTLDDERLRAAVTLFVGLIVGTIALWRFVHHAFEARSAPHRPLPCSDAVAAHYRWWLVTLILFVAVFQGLPWLLQAADVADRVHAGLLEILKTGVLVLLLPFLLKKQLVLGLVAGPRVRWGYTIAAVLYPLAITLVLALLVLEIVGYGLLVAHIGAGVAASCGVILIAATVSEYLVDRFTHARPADPAKADAGGEPDARSQYVVDLATGFVRLAAFVGALIVILNVWRVPLRREWMDWRTYALGVLVLVVGLMVDRVVAAALGALQSAGRLPAATTGLMRRWVRVIIVGLVILSLVAIAGWRIDSIWTFLTTLLAMIAIGFVAVWSILSNILATLVILIWRPFNVGEDVEVQPDGIRGTVIDINFIYTILKSADGRRISVPNNLFAQKYIARQVTARAPQRTLAEQLEHDKPLDA